MDTSFAEREAQRLKALYQLHILDTPVEAAFDRITELAAMLFDVPVALVSLIDENRQWFKSCYGEELLGVRETGRDVAFCAHAVEENRLLVVPDATRDARFAENPLVIGEPHIRFYAGALLKSRDGFNLGTLCLLDFTAREFGERERALLQKLAAIASEEIERRREEEDARRSENRLRTLVASTSDIITLLGPDGTIRYESAALERVLGYTPAELEGRNVFEFVHPDDMAQVGEAFRRVLDDPAYAAPVEFRFRHRDGSWRFLETLGRNRLDDPNVAGVVVTSRDITERRQAQDALRESEEQLRLALDAGHMGVWKVDLQAEMVFWSPRMETVHGLPIGGFDGTREGFLRCVYPDDRERVDHLSMQAIETGHEFITEYRALWPDGSVHWLEARGVPFFTDDGHATHLSGVSADISERKTAEATLRESEERFKSAFSLSAIGMALVSLTGHWMQVNRRLCDIVGYSEAELLALTFQDITHPDDMTADLNYMQQMLAGQISSYEMEKRYFHKDGHIVSILLSVSLVRGASEQPLYFISQVQDISARKAAEAQLQETARRVTSILESISDAFFSVDSEWRFTYVNDQACNLLMRRREELLGHSLWDQFPEATGSAFGREYRRAVETRAPVTFEGFNTPLGAWFEVHAYPSEEGLSVYFRDVSERRRNEERLRLMESVAVNARDGILITEARPIDAPGPRILYANRGMAQMTGYSIEEMIGRSPRFLQGPDTSRAALDAIRAGLEQWQPVVVELINYRKDGTPYWVEMSLVPVANESGEYTHFVSLQNDITRRKQSTEVLAMARDEAERQRAIAERANAAKSEFLSRMSHELRTPLNAILGFGQLLETSELTPDDLESAEHIVKAGGHLLELINEVLDIARIESGRLSLSPEPVGVRAVCEEVLALVRPLVLERGLTLRDESAGCTTYVQADQQRLKQVLLNLLSNAVKYNRDGGSITLSYAVVSAERLRLCVSDEGKGIALEHMGRLFTPFERLGAETSGIEGTGIGLALSRRLAEAMDGTLDVQSTPGQGSTFWIELPIASAPAQEQMDDEMPDEQKVRDMTRRRILYIEDNLSNLQLIRRLLQRRPEIELISAMQGRMGLELANQHLPDLILLDLNLPEMSGDEVLRRLRANPTTHAIPVVILSADATRGQIQRLMDAGAQRYLTKPLDVREFLRTLDELLEVKSEA